MNLTLWNRLFADARWLLLACLLYAISFSWARVFIVSELDTSQFRQILDLLPDTFKTFTPVDFDWLVSYVGRIAFNFDEPMLVVVMAIWCIARSSECVSGQLASGTMEMLLAQPISRTRHYLTHCSVTILGVAALALGTWLGMYGGVETATVDITTSPYIKIPFTGTEIPLPFLEGQVETVAMRDLVDCRVFWPGVVNLFAFGFFLAGVTAFCSSWDRYRWRTIGIVSGLYIVMALIKVLSMSVRGLSWTGWFTFFSLYEPEVDIAMIEKDSAAAYQLAIFVEGNFVGLGPFGNNLCLMFFGAAFWILGLVIFQKRDLPAPI